MRDFPARREISQLLQRLAGLCAFPVSKGSGCPRHFGIAVRVDAKLPRQFGKGCRNRLEGMDTLWRTWGADEARLWCAVVQSVQSEHIQGCRRLAGAVTIPDARVADHSFASSGETC